MDHATLPLVDDLKAGPPIERGDSPPSTAAANTAEIDVGHLIGEHPGRWLPLSAVWLAVAFMAGFGLFVNYQAQGRETTLVASLMAMIPHYFFWVIMSPPIYRALHRTLEGGRRALWTSTLIGISIAALAGSATMSYISYVIRHDLNPGFGQFVDIYVRPPAGPAFWAMNFSILLIALAGLAVVRGLRLRDQALWSAAQTELHRARLEAQLADARYVALQAQINPHFLFNSLNAIAGLVETGERGRATDAIARLGELLQMALRNGRFQKVTLGEEIDFLKRYLMLCKLRFDSQFDYWISIPESLRKRRVPALIVQPLIENSIRHGMRESRKLNVGIRAYERNAEIVIEVEDDGGGISTERAAALPAGHGLANVQERLRLCFGEAGTLHLEPRRPRGTRARISISG